MKVFLLVLASLLLVNCGGKNFSGSAPQKSQDDNLFTDDDFLDDNNDDDDDDIPDIADPEDEICPRYDVVVKSTHKKNERLNFNFTFNGEMTFKATAGDIKIQFSKAKYSSCSGSYTNTSIQTALVPLQAVEDLTSEILITHDAACAAVVPDRVVTISVVDSATSQVLFSEQTLRNEIGSCEFSYTSTGLALRNKIVGLADGVANAKGAACN